MKQQLEQFAPDYDRAEERLAGQGDDQSSIHYPALYLFIGDKAGEAIGAMKEIHDRKWDNSRGVMYLWVTTAGGASVQAEESPAVKHHVLAGTEGGGNDPKKARAELYRKLYDSGQGWFELNRTLRQVSSHIAEYGRLYASFDRIHLSVITRVDDPLNVFVQELSLLAKSILGQSFKSVQMDLYALISEREQVEAFGYGSSAGVAFLRELDYMQQPDYSFSAPLHVTEDGISIPVTHQASPLFDLVYVLSDRNERGLLSADELQGSYEMISHISLLKNRKYKEQVFGPGSGSYNNTSFKNNVMTESGRQGYVSAGMAKVKRPNQSIALVVLYHFLRQVKADMAAEPEVGEQEKLSMFGVHPAGFEEQAARLVPDVEAISEMHALMTHEVSYASLRQMSLREAEQALYGEGCRAFFRSNYEDPARRGLEQMDVAAKLENELRSRTSAMPMIGLFQLYHWTGERKEEGGMLPYVQNLYRETQRELELARFELEQAYEGRVEQLSFKKVPFMDKRNVRSFISELFRSIYYRKRDLLMLEIKMKLISRYEAEIEAFHKRCEAKIHQFEKLEQQLRASAQESVTWADDYIGQNIMEYYELVTKRVTDELKAKRGSGAFFEDRLLGNQRELLEQGTEGFLSKLIKVCREHILTSPYFKLSFEEELLQRSNVTIEYNNKEVLSKDDLFKKLYRTLEDRAAIQLRLYDYTQEHRYEEKYVFGDMESEFVRYVFSVDESSRIYKLGGVHEKRSSGVVKLNLMGGFHLEDLMYYRNGKVYYESYVANGYELHGLDPARLPELR
ncbi:transcription initiation factor TFIID [Paenibacillus brevis]|uniref:Transcription initiation factor TFIID n=1 Tax=Paenibacillus brevis TaxID=2841508 RepID=A0ABS6FKE4_9BACL|nr:transcription initiation factor TFIID [Paenibacillus brevis]MBU5670640.1 transcription initiation factor TFIID [Paenibacillus brevis]